MVLFFKSSAIDPPVVLYMGKDKVENEDLIKYAWPQDLWFHVDKLSSAHPLLTDCAQLVKANSIEGNKKDNLTIIYTPADNLKKTGDMAVGQVSFHNDKRRENPIVNRLNKTKVERQVDHEEERVERIKNESAARRAAAQQKKKADEELARQRAAEKAARSYDTLFDQQAEDDDDGMAEAPKRSVREMEDDFM
ncbi:cytoplasmic protein [Fomitopsis serialis]|uniref:cytoplasmic protein n=1 Tax=Fomitopsis serialis TaxID=139415 RepID=UPI002007A31F|nr:cytoplasmic protein [Neoantrodia serialis]KAH9922919.1 cytoplasmic protein [Neoantrodia serialis]